MTSLMYRRCETSKVRELVLGAPREPYVLSREQRDALGARLREVRALTPRRIDAWTVERAGRAEQSFRWSPAASRRTLGKIALTRVLNDPAPCVSDAVDEAVSWQLLRAASGHARLGSMAHWLAGQPAPGLALIKSEAANWVIDAHELLDHSLVWRVSPSDVYYDVARARTTLRGRRDLEAGDNGRVIVRIRSGSPGKSAGPGLRTDLAIHALAAASDDAPTRIVGLWPSAGVCLAVDATIDDLRAGARDLVRTAVVLERQRALKAA